MIQQLVMYEEELTQINRICEVLHKDSNARAVLVIDKNGQAFAHAGEVEQLDITSLSSLTAGNVAATGENKPPRRCAIVKIADRPRKFVRRL